MKELIANAISPFNEIVAYEALWENRKASFKSLAELFSKAPNSKPSDFVSVERIDELSKTIRKIIFKQDFPYKVNLLIRGSFDYPLKLNDAKEPLELLYYAGDLDLLSTKSVSVVGARNATKEGLLRTAKITSMLVKEGYTIVSGLAKGIDTQAHTTAIREGGKTIAVIGTPLNTYYPKENVSLQNRIAKDYLLLSQVPFYRYTQQHIHGNKLFFPERNKTMSAISKATIIVEASDTSGTLVQAKAALEQNRKLFILNSCFENSKITWPAKYEKLGAIRVIDFEDVISNLK